MPLRRLSHPFVERVIGTMRPEFLESQSDPFISACAITPGNSQVPDTRRPGRRQG